MALSVHYKEAVTSVFMGLILISKILDSPHE
jgi:hypothetical protein